MFVAAISKGIFLLIFCFFVNFCNSIKHREFPSYIQRCKISDPKVSECLLKSTETIRPYLMKGIPELGLSTIDPAIIPELRLVQETKVLNFTAVLKNVKIKGLSTYKFSQFNFDVPNLQFFTNWTVDVFSLEGEYALAGTVLGSPIEGKGNFAAGVDNCKTNTNQNMKRIKKGGVDYIHPTNTTNVFTAEHPWCRFDGLFDGDRDSNKFLNKLIEDNINDLFQDMKPLLEKVCSKVVEEWLINHFEGVVSFEQLYIN